MFALKAAEDLEYAFSGLDSTAFPMQNVLARESYAAVKAVVKCAKIQLKSKDYTEWYGEETDMFIPATLSLWTHNFFPIMPLQCFEIQDLFAKYLSTLSCNMYYNKQLTDFVQ